MLSADERAEIRQRRTEGEERDTRDAAIFASRAEEMDVDTNGTVNNWLTENMPPPGALVQSSSAAGERSSGPIDGDSEDEPFVSASVVNSSVSDFSYVPNMTVDQEAAAIRHRDSCSSSSRSLRTDHGAET